MGGALPKQYLVIDDRTVLDHSVGRLLEFGITRVVVAVSALDDHWQTIRLAEDARVRFVTGGESRRESVLSGLAALAAEVDDDDFVMVHDAARPCVGRQDIERLEKAALEHGVGGLLAIRIADTVKVGTEGDRPAVRSTLARDSLWRALTPQMFRFGLLLDALRQTRVDDGITDESSAIESMGYAPVLVEGSPSNIKITYPDDIRLARLLLAGEEIAT